MVQRRAARYVTNRHGNRSCVIDVLSHLDWKSLETHRKEARLCMLFNIKHELVAINKSDSLIESQSSHVRLGNNKFIVPQSKCDYRKESFFFPENYQGLEQTTFRHCVSRVAFYRLVTTVIRLTILSLLGVRTDNFEKGLYKYLTVVV